jgi:hypothetical protein
MITKLFSVFTDREGNLDIAVLLGLIAFAAFIYFAWHQYIVLGKDFDPQSFGLGAGGLAAGHGAAKMWGNSGDYGKEN